MGLPLVTARCDGSRVASAGDAGRRTALVMGCGGAYPDAIKVGASCTSAGGVHVEVEAGMGNDAAGVCWSVGQALDIYRATYEERWGPVDLAGWTLRVRSTTLGDGAAGATWWDERLIEVEPHMLDALPHELRRVQLSTVAMSLAKADADLIVAAVNSIPRTHHLAAIVDRLAVQVAEVEASCELHGL